MTENELHQLQAEVRVFIKECQAFEDVPHRWTDGLPQFLLGAALTASLVLLSAAVLKFA
jgi:hypothetical protein